MEDLNQSQPKPVNYSFVPPVQKKEKLPIIKVIGVGGGGSYAVKHMHESGIKGVDFMVVNTDEQALDSNAVQKKLCIGRDLTDGNGAGGKPEVGEKAAIESEQEIREALSDGTQMVFITAGMGGGTGTGASPIIARVAKELKILTVAIVTLPTRHEGPKKMALALDGVRHLKQYCDAVLVIPQDKVMQTSFKKLSVIQAFKAIDGVLLTSAKYIAELITVYGHPNLDFNDVRSALQNAGTVIMGTGTATGDNGALNAAIDALASPLLDDYQIAGAKYILIGFFCGNLHVSFEDVQQVAENIQELAGNTAELKYSVIEDTSLDDEIRVSIVATGFEDANDSFGYEPGRLNDWLNGVAKSPEAPKEPVAPAPPKVAPMPFSGFTAYAYTGDQTSNNVQEPPQPGTTPNGPTNSYSFEEPVVSYPEPSRTGIGNTQPLWQTDANTSFGSTVSNLNTSYVAPVNGAIDPVAEEKPQPSIQPQAAPEPERRKIYDASRNLLFGVDAQELDPLAGASPNGSNSQLSLEARRLAHEEKMREVRNRNAAGGSTRQSNLFGNQNLNSSSGIQGNMSMDNDSKRLGRTYLNRDNELRTGNSFLDDQVD